MVLFKPSHTFNCIKISDVCFSISDFPEFWLSKGFGLIGQRINSSRASIAWFHPSEFPLLWVSSGKFLKTILHLSGFKKISFLFLPLVKLGFQCCLFPLFIYAMTHSQLEQNLFFLFAPRYFWSFLYQTLASWWFEAQLFSSSLYNSLPLMVVEVLSRIVTKLFLKKCSFYLQS